MARFFGELGYVGASVETSPGVYEEQIIEKAYYGDVIRNARRLSDGGNVNSDIFVSTSISILADAYAITNTQAIRYLRWDGVLWVVTTAEYRRPRLLLELGGVYNGPTPGSS